MITVTLTEADAKRVRDLVNEVRDHASSSPGYNYWARVGHTLTMAIDGQEPTRPDAPLVVQPNIKLSVHKVAVDQNYFWDLDMKQCPQGKVQLLSKGGLPCYGKPSQAPGFYVAWAAVPKLPPHFNPEIFK